MGNWTRLEGEFLMPILMQLEMVEKTFTEQEKQIKVHLIRDS